MNHNKFVRILLLLVLAAPSMTIAANVTSDKWTLVHTNQSGVKSFFIEKTVFTRGELRRVDLQFEYPQPIHHSPFLGKDRANKMVKTFVYGAWLDCTNSLIKLYSFLAYDKNDRWVDGYTPTEANFTRVTSDSNVYPVMVAVCALEIPPDRQNN